MRMRSNRFTSISFVLGLQYFTLEIYTHEDFQLSSFSSKLWYLNCVILINSMYLFYAMCPCNSSELALNFTALAVIAFLCVVLRLWCLLWTNFNDYFFVCYVIRFHSHICFFIITLVCILVFICIVIACINLSYIWIASLKVKYCIKSIIQTHDSVQTSFSC